MPLFFAGLTSLLELPSLTLFFRSHLTWRRWKLFLGSGRSYPIFNGSVTFLDSQCAVLHQRLSPHWNDLILANCPSCKLANLNWVLNISSNLLKLFHPFHGTSLNLLVSDQNNFYFKYNLRHVELKFLLVTELMIFIAKFHQFTLK
jgi:hypothetical protein